MRRNSHLALEHFEGGVNINARIPPPAPLSRAFAVQEVKKKPYTNENGAFPWDNTDKQRRQRHGMAQPAAESVKSPNDMNEILCYYTQLVQKPSCC